MSKYPVQPYNKVKALVSDDYLQFIEACTSDDQDYATVELPFLPLREIVFFPGLTMSFEVGRVRSKIAVKKAMNQFHRYIFLTCQQDPTTDWPADRHAVHEEGCIARIVEMIDTPEDTLRIRVVGIARANILEYQKDDSAQYDHCVSALSMPYPYYEDIDNDENMIKVAAAAKYIFSELKKFAEESGRFSQETIETFHDIDDPGRQIDVIASLLNLTTAQLQMLLNERSVYVRQLMIGQFLEQERSIFKCEKTFSEQVKQAVEQDQKEYYLREQLKVIHRELGDEANAHEEVDRYLNRLKSLPLADEHKVKIEKEIKRLPHYPSSFPESANIRTYLDTVFDLPWGKMSQESLSIHRVRKQLDSDHYGLEDVKERILEHLAVLMLHQQTSDQPFKAPILCLVGPPGVGKTSIAQSIAKAVGRKFVRMSLGGVRDEAEIRGHRRTYIGSLPGRIISAIQQAKTDNPLILLDEIDKLGNDFRGDPASAMLEVLDPEQNHSFRDHYLEVPYDLSNVMFITTANNPSTIPQPLLDRMEMIELSGYTEEEKYQIAKLHLLVRQIERNGLKKSNIKLNHRALYQIIRCYTREAGVRQLDRVLAKLCRKVVLKFSDDWAAEKDRLQKESGNQSKTLADFIKNQCYSVTVQAVSDLLGKPKYRYDVIEKEDPIGVVTGLAWTAVGGDTLTIEVGVSKGSGKIELTGSLGDVMKESAKVAIAYVRSRADVQTECPQFPEKMDVHIHVPEGAVPKDGPSAGVTLTTALYSALMNRAVRHDLAMTGEVTIRGRVLPIGGLKEKIIAAHRAGVKHVLIPEDNKRDIEDIPESVRSVVEIKTVAYAEDVLKHAMVSS